MFQSSALFAAETLRSSFLCRMVASLDGISFRYIFSLLRLPVQRVTSLCCTPDSVLTQTILDVETDEAFCPAMGGSEAGAVLPGGSFGAAAGEVAAVKAVGFLELFFFCAGATSAFFFSVFLVVLQSVLV